MTVTLPSHSPVDKGRQVKRQRPAALLMCQGDIAAASASRTAAVATAAVAASAWRRREESHVPNGTPPSGPRHVVRIVPLPGALRGLVARAARRAGRIR